MSKNRIKHEIFLGKSRTEQLSLIGAATKTAYIAAKIVKNVCDHGFYHWQLSHDAELMVRLDRVAESHKIARSELVHIAVMDYLRKSELENEPKIGLTTEQLETIVSQDGYDVSPCHVRIMANYLLKIYDLTDDELMEMHRQIIGLPNNG